MRDLNSLSENRVERGQLRQFAGIIGANPSTGARSPKLWNAVFAARGMNVAMLPIDVTAANLPELLNVLDADRAFIGGAIAAPYKEKIASWLGERISPEAAKIGAVNCLYRGTEGHLMGTNTDGEAALASYVAKFGAIAGKRVLLLGAGGAGKAVATYFTNAVMPSGKALLATRSDVQATFAHKLDAAWLAWNQLDVHLPDVDAVVNCTSIGWGEQSAASPLSIAQLARLRADAVVFDIVYQPRPTELLRMAAARGLRTLDGLAMNLEQAVLAFAYAVPKARDREPIRAAMQAAANNA